MSQNSRPGRIDTVKWEAVAWLLLAALAYWFAWPFDNPLPYFGPGAAFWPKIILVIIVLAAIVLLTARFVVTTRREEETVAYLDEFPDDVSGIGWRTIAIFLLPLVWTLGMHKMGFLLVTPFFLLAFTWLMGVRKWSTLIGFSVLFYAAIVLIFYKIIFTSLPMGAGFFHTINGEIMGWIQ